MNGSMQARLCWSSRSAAAASGPVSQTIIQEGEQIVVAAAGVGTAAGERVEPGRRLLTRKTSSTQRHVHRPRTSAVLDSAVTVLNGRVLAYNRPWSLGGSAGDPMPRRTELPVPPDVLRSGLRRRRHADGGDRPSRATEAAHPSQDLASRTGPPTSPPGPPRHARGRSPARPARPRHPVTAPTGGASSASRTSTTAATSSPTPSSTRTRNRTVLPPPRRRAPSTEPGHGPTGAVVVQIQRTLPHQQS